MTKAHSLYKRTRMYDLGPRIYIPLCCVAPSLILHDNCRDRNVDVAFQSIDSCTYNFMNMFDRARTTARQKHMIVANTPTYKQASFAALTRPNKQHTREKDYNNVSVETSALLNYSIYTQIIPCPCDPFVIRLSTHIPSEKAAQGVRPVPLTNNQMF